MWLHKGKNLSQSQTSLSALTAACLSLHALAAVGKESSKGTWQIHPSFVKSSSPESEGSF